MDELKEQHVKRREDRRFVTGKGRYTSDVKPDGTLHLAFVRSPYAHARVASVNTEAAKASDGVVAVITGEELYAAGYKDSPGGFHIPRPDGQPAPKTDRPALATLVRHIGEPVAAVVARSIGEALAGVELVEIEYDELPAVISPVAAMESGAPAVWDATPDNVGFRWQGGDLAATDAALQSAAHVTRKTLTVSRVAVNSMEPRNVLVIPQDNGRLLVHASHQSPFQLRDALHDAGFEKGSIHVQIGDVGGSFGLKVGFMVESVAVAYAAKLLKRPVIWDSTRSEAFLSDDQCREEVADVEIGFTAQKRIVALKVSVKANLGAYLNIKSIWAITNIGGVAGVYKIPAIHAEVYGVFTTTLQTGAYRGAGRPEATYLIERALDVAAAELNISPYELRRRNLIPAKELPYQTALVFNYDCGDFEENMVMAAKLADMSGYEARRKEAKKRGKLRGLGVANSIESAGGPFRVLLPDISRVSLLTDGRLRVHTGSMSVGQSLETVFPQIVADMFGVSADEVEYSQGDTDDLPFGRGNGGSSASGVGGPAVTAATVNLRKSLIEIGAKILNTSAESVTFSEGILRSKDANRTLSLAELASVIEPASPGVAVSAEGQFKPPDVTYPNGTHICEVEVDPDTGHVDIVGYAAVEDIGTVINPMVAEGQIQGGIVQGLGQAIGEEVAFDDSGQILTASFMDYKMPKADDLPNFKMAFHPVPTKVNPLGVKGVGEAGTVGAMVVLMNAVQDALKPLGAEYIDMPATPARVWQAINAARSAASTH